MNNVIRNYCETEASKYYVGLDHSFILYSVYVLLLIALLFSFVINWFPSGIPEVTLEYEAERAITALNVFKKDFKINIDKKGQYAYKRFENEEDVGPENGEDARSENENANARFENATKFNINKTATI